MLFCSSDLHPAAISVAITCTPAAITSCWLVRDERPRARRLLRLPDERLCAPTPLHAKEFCFTKGLPLIVLDAHAHAHAHAHADAHARTHAHAHAHADTHAHAHAHEDAHADVDADVQAGSGLQLFRLERLLMDHQGRRTPPFSRRERRQGRLPVGWVTMLKQPPFGSCRC